MRLPKLFRPKWRHPDAGVRLATIANIHDPKRLYHIATCSRDERLCLEAAHRLNDPILLTRLARNATQEDIRFEAALLVRDEATLAAMALDGWHISHGEMAVVHINNTLLLRRLARSARQDAIRFAAAKKLNDPDLLGKVAQTSNNIHIRWQAALHLDDPQLLAEIACFKPEDSRLADLRNQARSAFHDHLDQRIHQMDQKTIAHIIKSVADPLLKLDAFLKLKPHQIPHELIYHLSHQDFHSVRKSKLRQLFHKILFSGRQIQQTTQSATCRQCQGIGKLTLKSIPADSSHLAHELSTCSECQGTGQLAVQILICKHPPHPDVIFRFPPDGRIVSPRPNDISASAIYTG